MLKLMSLAECFTDGDDFDLVSRQLALSNAERLVRLG